MGRKDGGVDRVGEPMVEVALVVVIDLRMCFEEVTDLPTPVLNGPAGRETQMVRELVEGHAVVAKIGGRGRPGLEGEAEEPSEPLAVIPDAVGLIVRSDVRDLAAHERPWGLKR